MKWASSALEAIKGCKRVKVTSFHMSEGGTTWQFLTGNQAAAKVASIAYRKYVCGEQIKLTIEYDYRLSCKVITQARYSNGFTENFRYEKGN